MSTIRPGHDFGTNELVTQAKLRDYVEGATISDCQWSEVDSSLPRFAVVSDTAFSLGPQGSVWFDRVNLDLMVMTRWGPCALWSPLAMETRRLPFAGGGILPPFKPVSFSTVGSLAGGVSEPAVVLAAGTDINNLATKVIGVSQYATAVSLGGEGQHVRIKIIGITKIRFGAHTQVSAAGQYGGISDADGAFSLEPAETADRSCACILGLTEDDAASANQASHTGLIYFFPGNWWRV